MTGGMYPISSSPFGEFWNLGGFFLHIVNFEFLLLFVCSIWNGWGKEGTRWADTVGPLGLIEYDLPPLCDFKVDEIKKSVDYTRVASQYQFSESNQPVL